MNASDWQSYRALFPALQNWAYFGWASVAPLSIRAREAMQMQLQGVCEHGVTQYRDWYRSYDGVRECAARLLNAGVDEIALVKNTSEGISTVAFGLDWRAGDNLLLPEKEFPANAYPWLALRERGIEVRRIPCAPEGGFTLEAASRLLDGRTRLLAVSSVHFANGYRLDLRSLGQWCRAHGLFFFVDAIQSLGADPLDLSALLIDALAADGHKWLCGPEGMGLLYVRREHLQRIEPLSRGWWSVKMPGRFERDDQALCESARRFECGTLTTVAAYGLRAALKLCVEVGPAAMRERILELRENCVAMLGELGAEILPCPASEHRSGIVSFVLPEREAVDVAQRLESRNVLLNPRNGRLRLAVHAWNDLADIERLRAALATV